MITYNSNEGALHTDVVWFLWFAADTAHAIGQLVAIDYSDSTPDVAFSAARPSDAARYRYDAAGNPVDSAELGLNVTNSFNTLNQIVTGSWTGSTVTVAGSVNYPGKKGTDPEIPKGIWGGEGKGLKESFFDTFNDIKEVMSSYVMWKTLDECIPEECYKQ